MPQIHILSEKISNKIAAGEVVQRPASALKEIIENSIDAAASRIEIRVEDGGKKLIQVIDDGDGMEEEDLQLAFQRHATSKIASEEDLNRIRTLGFRGEALASIASVARVDIKSRSVDSDLGYEMQIQGGEVRKIEPVGMNAGTQITVRDLFFNTPARQKFLKGKPTEFRHISEAVKRFALGYPEVHFELYHNDRETYLLPPSSLKERIGSLFSPSYIDNLIELDEEYRNVGVHGYLGNLDLVRKSRGEQYIFLNNRYISDNLINTAVYKGFGSLIQRGEYPFFVLNLELEPAEFDVNVHPAKMEVKFKDQWQLFNYLRSLVERSLRDVLNMTGYFTPRQKREDEGGDLRHRQSNWTDTIRPQEGPKYETGQNEPQRSEMPRFIPTRSEAGQEEQSSSAAIDRVNRFATRKTPREDSIAEKVWQVHDLYILSQIKSGVVVIDQHAAHERILFEEAMNAFEHQNVASQQLLFPQVVELSAEDYEIMLNLLPYLEKIGFELKEFGRNTVIVNATPSDMRGGDEAKLIREIIDDYKERRDKDNPTHYKLAASYSCKAAIKAGDQLSDDEIRALIHQLFQCQNPYHCPHGRPVIVNLTLEELHKRFERI